MAPFQGPNGGESSQDMTLEQVEITNTMSGESTTGCGGLNADDILQMHQNDDDSMGDDSIHIFEQDDFQEETWTNVVTPTRVVAVLAGVGLFTVLSPLLFVSFAATAVGAVHVVTHAQELLLEEYEIWKNGDNTIEQSNNVESKEVVSPTKVDDKEPSTHENPNETAPAESHAPTTTTIAPNATFETVRSSDDEETLHSHVLTQRFPPLEDEVLVKETFEGLNAVEFFHVFISDDAPFSFREFQTKRGDFDIVYGNWNDATTPLTSSTKMQHLKRTISFKTQTKSLFGPPHATCIKQQEVFMNKRVLIMETNVQLQGVPFCDRFHVQERWILVSPKSKVATLDVYSQVFFSEPCAFEQQIHSKSCSTLREVVASWCTMAQQALSITIRQKLERERRQASKMSHVKSECSIEVAQSLSGKSFVVGEDVENEPPCMVVVASSSSSDASPRKTPLASLRRSVLSRISKTKTNQQA